MGSPEIVRRHQSGVRLSADRLHPDDRTCRRAVINDECLQPSAQRLHVAGRRKERGQPGNRLHAKESDAKSWICRKPGRKRCDALAATAPFFRACPMTASANSKPVRHMNFPVSEGMYEIPDPARCRVSVVPRAAFLAEPHVAVRNAPRISSSAGHPPHARLPDGTDLTVMTAQRRIVRPRSGRRTCREVAGDTRRPSVRHRSWRNSTALPADGFHRTPIFRLILNHRPKE